MDFSDKRSSLTFEQIDGFLKFNFPFEAYDLQPNWEKAGSVIQKRRVILATISVEQLLNGLMDFQSSTFLLKLESNNYFWSRKDRSSKFRGPEKRASMFIRKFKRGHGKVQQIVVGMKAIHSQY